MGDSCWKVKHWGMLGCLSRLILVICVLTMGSSYWGEPGPLYGLIAINVIGMIISCCIGAKHVETSVNGRQLSQKERKRCMRKAYIYTVMVAGNVLWIVSWFVANDYIASAFDPEFIWPVVAVFGIMDVFFIKTKNMKYACVSYLEDDHEKYSGDAYKHASANQGYTVEPIYNPEMAYMQQPQPGQPMMMGQPG